MEWYDYNSYEMNDFNYQGQYDYNLGNCNANISMFDTSYDYQNSHNNCMNSCEISYYPSKSYMPDFNSSYQPQVDNYSQPNSSECRELFNMMNEFIVYQHEEINELMHDCQRISKSIELLAVQQYTNQSENFWSDDIGVVEKEEQPIIVEDFIDKLIHEDEVEGKNIYVKPNPSPLDIPFSHRLDLVPSFTMSNPPHFLKMSPFHDTLGHVDLDDYLKRSTLPKGQAGLRFVCLLSSHMWCSMICLQGRMSLYKRFPEIERHCSSILSSGSKLMLNDAKVESIKNELSFCNGDWDQENNGLYPLMPFDAADLPPGTGSASLSLINFEVKDVKSLDDVQNGVGVGGVMSIGITKSKSFSADHRTMFSMNPGMSVLTIVFEGVYVETKENAGERLLCMLGNTTLPTRRWLVDWQNAYWNWGHENCCPDLVQDDQLVLVLKYPKISNLTARGIQGEMMSMHKRSSFKFFDKVLISSRVGWFSDYQFSPSKSSSCNTYAHQEELMETNSFSASNFCKIFREMSNEVFNILPDQYTNYSPTENGKLGPFVLGKEVVSVDKNYKNVKLMIRNVKCKNASSDGKTSNAKVSAVFRLVPTLVNRDTASSRTGFSGMTLSAEGTWDASTGRLCMVGSVPKGMEAKVSMYFPRALTIRQRSIVYGSIEGLFSPLHLNFIPKPSHLEFRYGWYAGSYLSYNYSQIKQADEFRKRSQSNSIIRLSQQSVLRYPTIQAAGGVFALSQIYDLTGELYIDTEVAFVSGVSIKLEVLSIVQLTVFEKPPETSSTRRKTFTTKFAEGLYDPRTGMMYLIGCGPANTVVHVEQGLDCLMETTVQYPPQNFRWLRDPTIEIDVKSKRYTDDPLYFLPMRITSKTIAYDIFKQDNHARDVAFQKIFEGVLQVTVLLVEIAIIWSQQIYMDQNTGIASSVSPYLFALRIFSYCILLIIGKEILLPSKEAVSYHPYDLLAYQPVLKGLDYAAKLLALTALFLTTRLFCNVTKSTTRLNEEEPSNTTLTFGDWRYLLTLIRRFIFVYLAFLAFDLLSPLR
ncbi:uncharacterized protein LOC110715619 [Chenopodium quinoa]|uniref:uncharacterized protein LOC110715619 n=1 Tax=Chenopodium quinoa TaxID=63459 RepID=UPI000B785DDF|nr:uncharacterized protein LOC110715619 [Chenopodium quinoa]